MGDSKFPGQIDITRILDSIFQCLILFIFIFIKFHILKLGCLAEWLRRQT